MNRMRNEHGVIHLPMAVATLLCLTLFFGIWGTFRHWRGLVETQLRLDRCTGELALRLKSDWGTLLRSNREIQIGRASLVAGILAPPAIAAIRAALVAEVIRQDAIRARWELERVAWLVPGHCGKAGDLGFPLPDLGGWRPPPDPIGPRPLEWDPMPQAFVIRASHPPRHSAAEVRPAGEGPSAQKGDLLGLSQWRARWIAPTQISK